MYMNNNNNYNNKYYAENVFIKINRHITWTYSKILQRTNISKRKY